MDRLDEIVKRTKQHCWTWTEDATLRYLAEQASNSNIIIESGTYMGASAFCMMSAAPHTSHMWCMDKFMVAGTEFVTRQNLYPWIQAGRTEIIVGDSETGGRMLQHMKGKVDLCFIDDGHAVEDVQRDIRWLLPLMKSKGVLCGHDWEGNNDVAQGVKSMIPAHEIKIPVPRLWVYHVP